MNSCPNCHYTEFPFSKIRRANARKPLRCKKCGESIAKYHFAQPLLYSVAITAGAFALIPILLWNAYLVVVILFSAVGILFAAEYLEARMSPLHRNSELSKHTHLMISFAMSILGVVLSFGIFFLAVYA